MGNYEKGWIFSLAKHIDKALKNKKNGNVQSLANKADIKNGNVKITQCRNPFHQTRHNDNAMTNNRHGKVQNLAHLMGIRNGNAKTSKIRNSNQIQLSKFQNDLISKMKV